MMEIDLSQLSTEELQAALEQKRKEVRALEQKERRDFEKEKDQFIENLATTFKDYNALLKQLKNSIIQEANTLFNRMYEINHKEPKEVKTFSLKNANDTVKLIVDRQERFEFTDEAPLHIAAIKDIFREKFAQRNQGLYSLLDGLLIKNSKMEYDPKLLAKARKQVRALGDVNLIKEFDQLDDCQRVVGTSLYCRLYVRDERDKWRDVSLNFSSL